MAMPQPQNGQPGVATRTKGSSAIARVSVVTLLAAFVIGYGLAVYLTRDIWPDSREGTRLTFTAQTPDGSAPTIPTLRTTADVISERLKGRGATVAVDGVKVVVTVPGRNAAPDALGIMTTAGHLYIRPVLQAMTAAPQSPPLSSKPADPAAMIAFEKEIRQSNDPSIQMLALQVQANRCSEADPLTGHDDPNLPLVTCGSDSTGGAAVYLLDKAVLGGTDIAEASSGRDTQSGIYVVSLEFTPNAAKMWADFTSSHWQQGTQVAFAVDTRVISAPTIREPITVGKAEISGQFTQKSARELVRVLESGALPVPLTFTSATDGTLAATTMFKVLRVAIIGLGIGVAAIVIVAVMYLVRRTPDHAST